MLFRIHPKNLFYIHVLCDEISRRIAYGEAFDALVDLIQISYPDNLDDYLMYLLNSVETQALQILFEANMLLHEGIEISGELFFFNGVGKHKIIKLHPETLENSLLV